jgi:hypothetical protein
LIERPSLHADPLTPERFQAAPESSAWTSAFAHGIRARPALSLTGNSFDAAGFARTTACKFASPRFDAADFAGRRRLTTGLLWRLARTGLSPAGRSTLTRTGRACRSVSSTARVAPRAPSAGLAHPGGGPRSCWRGRSAGQTLSPLAMGEGGEAWRPPANQGLGALLGGTRASCQGPWPGVGGGRQTFGQRRVRSVSIHVCPDRVRMELC